MIKRWLIRSFFVLILAACVAAWAGSYWYRLGVERLTAGIAGPCMTIEEGTGVLVSPLEWNDQYDMNWYLKRGRWANFFARSYSMNYYSRWNYQAHYHQWGFAVDWGNLGNWDDGHGLQNRWFVMVPMWLITGFSSLMLGWVWWKTRSRTGGRAFPVEPAKTTADAK